MDDQGNQEKDNFPALGFIYQLKLLMLFLYRGVTRQYCFKLGTEIKEAKKFDDLVFQYKEGDEIVLRLLQAKHKLDETKKIGGDQLLTESDGDFSLIKYFFSYRDIITEQKRLKRGCRIKDVIICTNIGFDNELLAKELTKIEDKDDIFDSVNDLKQSLRYRLKEEFAPLLKPNLHNYNLVRLARKLTECVLKAKPIQHHQENSIFNLYHNALAKDVIDVETKTFYDEFVNGEKLSTAVKKFRTFFLKEIERQSKQEITLKIINETLKGKEKIYDDKEIHLKLSKKFGKGKDQNWPNNPIADEEIKDFLNHLVFAVDQPNEEELGKIIQDELGKEFNITTEDMYNKFFSYMLNWFQRKDKEFLSHEDGIEFFEKAKKEISILSQMLVYEKELELIDINIRFKKRNELEKFFASGIKFWFISSNTPYLSSTAIYQGIRDSTFHSRRFLLKLDLLYVERQFILQSFKEKSKCLLIIVCEQICPKKYPDLSEIFTELKKVAFCSEKVLKQVIIIAPIGHELHMYLDKNIDNYIDKSLSVETNDLTQKSQNHILEMKKICLQEGEPLSIKQLLELDSETLGSHAILDKLNLDMACLEILFRDSIVNILSKQSQLSNMVSAHYKPYALIEIDQLRSALRQSDEDIFTFVAEKNEVKQILPEHQQDLPRRYKVMKSEPLDQHRFILLSEDQEGKQFKDLCQKLDELNSEKILPYIC